MDPNRVSTQTFTVKSNIQEIFLEHFYKNITTEDGKLTHGIHSVKYKNETKGQKEEKVKKPKKKDTDNKSTKKKNFLNCVTMIVFVGKKINIKFFKNGVFQLTGCKHIDHVILSIDIIRAELLKIKQHFRFDNGDDLIVYIKSAMRNIDFDLGYQINRFNLFNCLVNKYKDDDNVIIPDGVGNKMDTKIKLRLSSEEIDELPVIKLEFPSRQQTVISFKDCKSIIEPEKNKGQKKKDKFVSIFIFQNGKVLLSAADETLQTKYYIWFIELIKNISNNVKLCLPEKKTFYVKNI